MFWPPLARILQSNVSHNFTFFTDPLTYPTHRRLLNSAAKKLWAIHKYTDRFLLRFMGLKEAADLLLKNNNFIKKYWLKVVGHGFPIFCMSSDVAKKHLFKVFKEYLNRAISMFVCNEWPWCKKQGYCWESTFKMHWLFWVIVFLHWYNIDWHKARYRWVYISVHILSKLWFQKCCCQLQTSKSNQAMCMINCLCLYLRVKSFEVENYPADIHFRV